MSIKPRLSDVEHPQGENGPTTFVMARNVGREGVKKGARGCSATTYLEGPDSPLSRMVAEFTARMQAINEWEKRWGPLPYDRAEFLGFHVTFQAVYEVLVQPDD